MEKSINKIFSVGFIIMDLFYKVSNTQYLEIFRMSYTTSSTQQYIVNVADKHFTTTVIPVLQLIVTPSAEVVDQKNHRITVHGSETTAKR